MTINYSPPLTTIVVGDFNAHKGSYSYSVDNGDFVTVKSDSSDTETATDTSAQNDYLNFLTYSFDENAPTGQVKFTVTSPAADLQKLQAEPAQAQNGQVSIFYDIKLMESGFGPTAGNFYDYKVEVDIGGNKENTPPTANPFTIHTGISPGFGPLVTVKEVASDSDKDTLFFTKPPVVRDNWDYKSHPGLLAAIYGADWHDIVTYHKTGGASYLSDPPPPDGLKDVVAFFISTATNGKLTSNDEVIFRADCTVGDGFKADGTPAIPGQTAFSVITYDQLGPLPASLLGSTASGTNLVGSQASAGLVFTSTVDAVEALYIGYLGQAGDVAGMDSWVGQVISARAHFSARAAAFAAQPGVMAQYPFLANPQAATPAQIDTFITSAYQDVFHRASNSTE